METNELRLRCIEAAVKTPQPGHVDGPVAAVLEAAGKYFNFVQQAVTEKRPTLGIPGKQK